jgi:hypothetical protein
VSIEKRVKPGFSRIVLAGQWQPWENPLYTKARDADRAGDLRHMPALALPQLAGAPKELSGEYHELAGIKIKLNKPGAGGRGLYWNSTRLAVKVSHLRRVGVQRGVDDDPVMASHS